MVTNDKMQRFKHHTEQQVYHSSKDTQQVDMRNGFNIQTEYANCLIQTVGESPVVHHNSVFPSFSSVHSTGRLLSLCFIQGSFRSPEESLSNEYVPRSQFGRSRSHGFSAAESTTTQPTLRNQKKPKYFEGVRKSLQRSRKLDNVSLEGGWKVG